MSSTCSTKKRRRVLKVSSLRRGHANLTMKSNNPPPVRRVAADHTVDAHTRAIRLRSIRVADGDNSHDDFAIRWLTLSSVHQL